MKRKIPIFLLIIFSAAAGCVYGKLNINSDSMNILEKGKVSEFVGNVVVSGSGFNVTAQKAISDENTGIIKAHNTVKIIYTSGTWRMNGWCDNLEIDPGSEKLFMEGKVKTIYTPMEVEQDTSTVIYADKVWIDYSEKQEALFTGRVIVERNSMSVYSGRARYLNNEQKIEFLDSPRGESFLNNTRTEYSGDNMSVFMKGEIISINGRAHTRIFLDESEMR